jgi:nucleotide-binding universal stress UspA family protein
MNKMLCATDASEISQKAEVLAANWAKHFGAELVYVYVSHITEEDMDPRARRSSVIILKDVALEEHNVLVHAKEVAEKVGAPNVQCVLLRSRKIAATLVKYANQQGVDHIVVGSAGRSGLKRLAMGSIAGRIIEQASCPVTVVR